MVLTVQLSLYVLKYSSWYCLGHSVMLLRLAGRLHVIWRCPRWPGSNITRSSGGSTAGESDIYFQMRVVSFLVKESVLVQTATLSGDQSTAASRHIGSYKMSDNCLLQSTVCPKGGKERGVDILTIYTSFLGNVCTKSHGYWQPSVSAEQFSHCVRH